MTYKGIHVIVTLCGVLHHQPSLKAVQGYDLHSLMFVCNGISQHRPSLKDVQGYIHSCLSSVLPLMMDRQFAGTCPLYESVTCLK